MLIAAGSVAAFVNRHPTVKMLALSFLLLIGMTLIADGFGAHISKGYIYAAISFSAAVETLNQIASHRRRRSSLEAARPPAAHDGRKTP
jgi:predicted tellurium resistance membrane protein TerC